MKEAEEVGKYTAVRCVVCGESVNPVTAWRVRTGKQPAGYCSPEHYHQTTKRDDREPCGKCQSTNWYRYSSGHGSRVCLTCQRDRKLAGECWHCQSPAVPGKSLCFRHAMRNAYRAMALRKCEILDPDFDGQDS